LEFKDNPYTIERYLSDESHLIFGDKEKIKGIYYPESEEDIKQILKFCIKNKIACNVSGGGTGVTGSRVPLFGGIVLSMERMINVKKHLKFKRIRKKGLLGNYSIAINEKKKEAYVPAGLSLQLLNEILPKNLFYPPDPTQLNASLGGTIATNASGAKGFYYGSTRSWIKEVSLVLGNGEFLKIKRGSITANSENFFDFTTEEGKRYRFKIPSYRLPDIKNSAGLYTKKHMDLIDLFIGSEGILGVVVEAKIALDTVKKLNGDIVFFKNEENAINFAKDLKKLRKDGLVSIEFFDKNSLLFIDKLSPIGKVYEACISIEFSNQTLSFIKKLHDLMKKHNVVEDWYANNSSELKKQKDFRRSLPESINSYIRTHNTVKLSTDFVVPENNFLELFKQYKNAERMLRKKFPQREFLWALFGHIGDCHLHFNFLTHNQSELEFANQIYASLAKKAVRLGGTISGEHGVGKKTIKIKGRSIPYLELMIGRKGLEEIARIKKLFDPNFILNPGNLILPNNFS
jgi:D-lactate dehydrogenase (cytochrome)